MAAEIAAFVERRGPVTLGVAGAGQMGTDLAVQCALMPGVRLGAISDRRLETARAAVLMSGRDADDMIVAGQAAAVDAAIEAGKIALVEDFRPLCAAGRIDVVIDATGNPNTGALVAMEAIRNGKHVVMLNVEADVTIGRLLKQEALKAGVVYTGAAGDEPAATIDLVGFAQSVGFDVIAAGKGKNNPLDFDAKPDQYEEEARRRNMNARMLVEFVDGSKTMVEMTAVANATGLTPDIPGMHGPKATRDDLASILCTKADGGILARAGSVDYSIGKGVAPGVFVVVKPRHPRAVERLTDLHVGKGPCFALFRPFHLTSLEVPLSALHAVATGRCHLQPLDRPVAECAALAKRPLRPGDLLGRIGQYDYRGFCMRVEDARAVAALPLGLAQNARVLKDIRPGEKLTYENCAPDELFVITQLKRRLDQADERFMAPGNPSAAAGQPQAAI